MPQRAPAPVYKAVAPLFDWNGFYIGANAGYGWGNTNREIPAVDAVNVPFLGQDPGVSLNGGVYGGHLGFNWVANSSWLFGLEGSFDGVDANKTVTSIAAPANSVATNSFNPRMRQMSLEIDRVDMGYHMLAGQSWSLNAPSKVEIRTAGTTILIEFMK